MVTTARSQSCRRHRAASIAAALTERRGVDAPAGLPRRPAARGRRDTQRSSAGDFSIPPRQISDIPAADPIPKNTLLEGVAREGLGRRRPVEVIGMHETVRHGLDPSAHIVRLRARDGDAVRGVLVARTARLSRAARRSVPARSRSRQHVAARGSAAMRRTGRRASIVRRESPPPARRSAIRRLEVAFSIGAKPRPASLLNGCAVPAEDRVRAADRLDDTASFLVRGRSANSRAVSDSARSILAAIDMVANSMLHAGSLGASATLAYTVRVARRRSR